MAYLILYDLLIQIIEDTIFSFKPGKLNQIGFFIKFFHRLMLKRLYSVKSDKSVTHDALIVTKKRLTNRKKKLVED